MVSLSAAEDNTDFDNDSVTLTHITSGGNNPYTQIVQIDSSQPFYYDTY